jgi:hypothetical protein
MAAHDPAQSERKIVAEAASLVAERAALFEQLWALEDAPRDDGMGDMLKADLHARIEQRLDVIGRG